MISKAFTSPYNHTLLDIETNNAKNKHINKSSIYGSISPVLIDSNIPKIAINHNPNTLTLSDNSLQMSLINNAKYKIYIRLIYRDKESESDESYYTEDYIISTCTSNTLKLFYKDIDGYITLTNETSLSLKFYKQHWYKIIIKSIKRIVTPTIQKIPKTSKTYYNLQQISLNTSTTLQQGITNTDMSFDKNAQQPIYHANNLWYSLQSGNSSLNSNLYSTDGINWQQSTLTSDIILAIHYYNNLWVAGVYNSTGKSGSGIVYSNDGVNWNKASGCNAEQIKTIKFLNGIWVACGVNRSYGGGLYYSTNGTSWTQCISNCEIDCIEYANGVWFAGGLNSSDQGVLYRSTNGISWSLVKSINHVSTEDDYITYDITGIYYNNGIWHICINNKGLHYISNTDYNISSVTLTKCFDSTVKDIIYIFGKWYGAHAYLYQSTDGINWQQVNISSTSSGYKKSLCYHKGFLYISQDIYGTADTRGLYYTKDGSNWTKLFPGIPRNSLYDCFVGLTAKDNFFCCRTSKNIYYFSLPEQIIPEYKEDT